MAIEDNFTEATVPGKTAYGKVIREQGTRRILIGAILLFVAWYIYSTIRTNMLLGVKWPELQVVPKGLTVLGLQDKDRPGWKAKYAARESSRSWQIRYREDMGPSNDTDDSVESQEMRDRPTAPPVSKRMGAQGAVVPMEELYKNCPTVLTAAHFTGARVEEKYEPALSRNYYALHVELSDEGRSRYWQFSREHDAERLVFVLNGEVMTCPRIKHMYVTTFRIDPIWIKKDAERLRDAINNQKP